MCEVIRAPFCPSGSFAIWTMISCPSRSRSLIEGSAGLSRFSRAVSRRSASGVAARSGRSTTGSTTGAARSDIPLAIAAAATTHAARTAVLVASPCSRTLAVAEPAGNPSSSRSASATMVSRSAPKTLGLILARPVFTDCRVLFAAIMPSSCRLVSTSSASCVDIGRLCASIVSSAVAQSAASSVPAGVFRVTIWRHLRAETGADGA